MTEAGVINEIAATAENMVPDGADMQIGGRQMMDARDIKQQ